MRTQLATLRWHHFFPLLFALLLAGCASTFPPAQGPLFSGLEKPAADQAGVYIYRPQTGWMYRGIFLYPYIDGKQIGVLKQTGFIYTTVNPGIHELYFRDNSGVLFSQSFFKSGQTTFNAQAGHTYFFRIVVTQGSMIQPGLYDTQNNLNTTPSMRAITELQGLRASS